MNFRVRTTLVACCAVAALWWFLRDRNPGIAGCVAPEPPQLGIPVDSFTLTLNGQPCGADQEPVIIPASSQLTVRGSFQLVGDQEVRDRFWVRFLSENPYHGVVFNCGGGSVTTKQSGRRVEFEGTFRGPTYALRSLVSVDERGIPIGYGYATTVKDEQ